MILLQVLPKSYKIASEYRYKIGTSLESKTDWQGRRVNLSKNVTCPDYPDFNMHLNRRIEIALGVFGPSCLVHELLYQQFDN